METSSQITYLNKVGLSHDNEHGIPSFISGYTAAQLASYARPRSSFESGQVSMQHFLSFALALLSSTVFGMA